VLVEATTALPLETEADTVAVGLFEDGELPARLPEGLLRGVLRSGEARGEVGRVAVLHAGERRVIVVGLGPRERFGAEALRVAAAAAHGRALELSARVLCWELPLDASASEPERLAAALVEGTLLHAYRFNRYRADPDADRRVERLIVAAGVELSDAVRRAAVIAVAQNGARALGDTPANDLPPRQLAEYASELASRHAHVEARVLDGDAIRASGMGAFAAVAQGSAEDARLIHLDYSPPAAGGPHLGFVGKGVTFDSGGISLKPSKDMHEMKYDMCGAAAVLEAIGAMAALELPVRVTCVVGSTENMPSGRAVKPGDIVRALDGTTIEINNTDAEGRLVLADCICYAREQGCERLVDLATLTGGVVVALGSVYTGLMSNDPAWGSLVAECGELAGDRVWALPLDEEYARMVEGRYAQLTNISEKREASTIVGAEFLHHFAGEIPWAHLDIAGTAWDVGRPYYVGKGATGVGVRLLVELARAVAGRA
jgi:leucyl aminopeptidase